MQQRPTGCLSRAADDTFPIKAIQQLQQSKHPSSCSSPRRVGMDDNAPVLPLYFPSSSIFRRSSAEKLVHLIPFLVLLCLLTLWWFSYPVNLVMKNGKIIAIPHLKTTQAEVEVAILASAISPVTPLPYNVTTNHGNGTQEEALPVNKTANVDCQGLVFASIVT
ncbi:hypothetical protein M5689_022013 [Euphorbia peplus]|nr:hypothetical protein M5689_022013 [Euphorbia peplus]